MFNAAPWRNVEGRNDKQNEKAKEEEKTKKKKNQEKTESDLNRIFASIFFCYICLK